MSSYAGIDQSLVACPGAPRQAEASYTCRQCSEKRQMCTLSAHLDAWLGRRTVILHKELLALLHLRCRDGRRDQGCSALAWCYVNVEGVTEAEIRELV